MNVVCRLFLVLLVLSSCSSYHQFCSNNLAEEYEPEPKDFAFVSNGVHLKDSTRIFLEIIQPLKNLKINKYLDSVICLKIYLILKNNYDGKKTLYSDSLQIINPIFQIRDSEHKPEAFLERVVTIPRFPNYAAVLQIHIDQMISGKKQDISLSKGKNDRLINRSTNYLYLPSTDLNSRMDFVFTNSKGKLLFRDYYYVEDTLIINPSLFPEDINREVTVYFFLKQFKASLPPMTSLDRLRIVEDEIEESENLVADQIYSVNFNKPLNFNKKGLYLFILKGKNGTEYKFSFRVHDNDYPLITELKQMTEPLIYLTTKDEFAVLKDSSESKNAMDKFWLKIAREKNHAKDMIREYYKRVEFCNRKFSTFKEGWKTDRGMIYIVFGAPQEVYRYNNYEIWEYYYDMNQQSVQFKFNRLENPFSLQHYVLDRSFQHLEPWYSAIEEWRNGILKIIKNSK